MLNRHTGENPINFLKPVVSKQELIEVQNEISNIMVSKDIAGYIISIVTATREDNEVKLGVSPRGAIALMNAARGHASINGRSYVIPDDVKTVAPDVLSHRIITKRLVADRTSASREIILKIISKVVPPSEQV